MSSRTLQRGVTFSSALGETPVSHQNDASAGKPILTLPSGPTIRMPTNMSGNSFDPWYLVQDKPHESSAAKMSKQAPGGITWASYVQETIARDEEEGDQTQELDNTISSEDMSFKSTVIKRNNSLRGKNRPKLFKRFASLRKISSAPQ